jgi:hypothetical protein
VRYNEKEVNTVMDYIVLLADGNPGALQLLVELATLDPAYLQAVDAAELYGEKLWVLFKDRCNENFQGLRVAVLVAGLRALPKPEVA